MQPGHCDWYLLEQEVCTDDVIIEKEARWLADWTLAGGKFKIVNFL